MTDRTKVGSDDWWLGRLLIKLMDRQSRYTKLNKYAKGDHPVPNGDQRYVKALRDLQSKATTNYVGLIIKAVTQRMRVKDFKFQGEVDQDAKKFWRFNNMELQSAVAIWDAAKYGDTYILVSPPPLEDEIDPTIDPDNPHQQFRMSNQDLLEQEKDRKKQKDEADRQTRQEDAKKQFQTQPNPNSPPGQNKSQPAPPPEDPMAGVQEESLLPDLAGLEPPVITVEDPRQCIVEHDPIRPMKTLAGLKLYEDHLEEALVACLYFPDRILKFKGPKPTGDFEDDMHRRADRLMQGGASAAGFELIEILPNELGEVPLIHGQWQPQTGAAECEDGALAIQDRINHTILDRMIITKNQAYRQRMLTGTTIRKGKDGKPEFDPGADTIWVSENPEAKVWDLEQADIQQLLEAIRDDIGDLAAVTQTPVTYLTNRMVNVSGDALTAAQASHASKVRERMNAMGWYFEKVIKTCYRYLDHPNADEFDSSVGWDDPEVRTLSEMADLVAKFAAAKIPMDLVMERAGFTSDEIVNAQEEIERLRQDEMQHAVQLASTGPPQMGLNAQNQPGKPGSSGGPGGGGAPGKKPGSTKTK